MKGMLAATVVLLVLVAASGAPGGTTHQDLSIRIAGASSISLGAAIRYRVTIANLGPSRAAKIVVAFRTAGHATIGVPRGCVATETGERCRRASLRAGQRYVLRFRVVPCRQGRFWARARVTPATPDRRPADNTARLTTHVGPGTPPPPPPGGFGC
jgi:Domain of unknown function DUF11